jgi:hypothetical protein
MEATVVSATIPCRQDARSLPGGTSALRSVECSELTSKAIIGAVSSLEWGGVPEKN